MMISYDYYLFCQSISGGQSLAEILLGQGNEQAPHSEELLHRGSSLNKVFNVSAFLYVNSLLPGSFFVALSYSFYYFDNSVEQNRFCNNVRHIG